MDNGSIESGLESSYMERFDAGGNVIIGIVDKKETFQVRSQRRECHPVATRAGMECRIKKTGSRPPQVSQEPKAVSEGIDNDSLLRASVISFRKRGLLNVGCGLSQARDGKEGANR